jgi:hypothetical protein
MASFNTHISAGIVLGVATATFIAAKEILPQSGAFLVATAVTVGAIMPDLDSDTSVPFHIVSSLLALIIGSLTYIYFKNILPDNGDIILRVIIAVLAVKFVVSPIIKKMTKHRGIWHSIPAAVIITIGSFLSLQVVDLEMRLRFYIAVALGAGYLSHLVLDEGVSLFRFKFLIFWSPKQSLGSALKLAVESKMVTMIAYMIIAILLVASYPSFKTLL